MKYPVHPFDKLMKMAAQFYNKCRGGVKTERVFPGLSVVRKNNKMEVLSPEKEKRKKGKIGPALRQA
jgi:hypothetical protein